MKLMNIRNEMEAMSPTQRRRFLKIMGACLAAPTIPAALRFAFNELAGGVKHAHAQEASQGTIFLEFNYRDQVDLMHVFVPPGIATHQNLKPGVNGEALSMFHPAASIVKSATTMSVELQRKLSAIIRRLTGRNDGKDYNLRVLVHPSILERLRSEDADLLVRMEKLFGVKLAFRADPAYHVENYKIINAVTGEEYR